MKASTTRARKATPRNGVPVAAAEGPAGKPIACLRHGVRCGIILARKTWEDLQAAAADVPSQSPDDLADGAIRSWLAGDYYVLPRKTGPAGAGQVAQPQCPPDPRGTPWLPKPGEKLTLEQAGALIERVDMAVGREVDALTQDQLAALALLCLHNRIEAEADLRLLPIVGDLAADLAMDQIPD